jgi:hypothetical protein
MFGPVFGGQVKSLMREVELQKSLMVAVATGGPRIQSVNHEYQKRRIAIQLGLKNLGIEDPNPFPDLWAWYGKWSDGSFPSY